MPVRCQYGTARKAAATAENHVTGTQLTPLGQYAPLLLLAARREHDGCSYYGEERFHGFAKALRSKYSEKGLNNKMFDKVFADNTGKPLC
jgi:hypothetical protein